MKGKTVAVVVSPAHFKQLEKIKAEGWVVIDEFRARKTDKDPDEVYKEVTKSKHSGFDKELSFRRREATEKSPGDLSLRLEMTDVLTTPECLQEGIIYKSFRHSRESGNLLSRRDSHFRENDKVK